MHFHLCILSVAIISFTITAAKENNKKKMMQIVKSKTYKRKKVEPASEYYITLGKWSLLAQKKNSSY